MSDRATTRAVVKYAENLRADAMRKMAGDPWAQPYYPTTAGARTLVKRIANERAAEVRQQLAGQDERLIEEAVREARAEAPELAIDELRRRAARADHKHREESQESERSLQRHTRRRAQHARDVAAIRAEQTLGQRLDACLAGLATVASASAAQLGGDRIQGGEREQKPPWAGDVAGYAQKRAHDLVHRLEALLASARSRDMERAA